MSSRNDCQESCYTEWTVNWSSNFYADDAKMEADLTQAYLKWVGSSASKYWSSYAGYDIGTEVKCIMIV